MKIERDPLIERAEAVIAETVQLLDAHEKFRDQALREVRRMEQIEAELDPLLPHPPSELAMVRALLANAED